MPCTPPGSFRRAVTLRIVCHGRGPEAEHSRGLWREPTPRHASTGRGLDCWAHTASNNIAAKSPAFRPDPMF